VILVSAPVIAILRDESTDGRYLGEVFIFWTFPMSTLGLIILPKFVAFRASDNTNRSSRTRGSSLGGHVHVSGIASNTSKDLSHLEDSHFGAAKAEPGQSIESD
jgi:hypothetical protein